MHQCSDKGKYTALVWLYGKGEIDSEVEGRMQLGRPKKKWDEILKEDIKTIILSKNS